MRMVRKEVLANNWLFTLCLAVPIPVLFYCVDWLVSFFITVFFLDGDAKIPAICAMGSSNLLRVETPMGSTNRRPHHNVNDDYYLRVYVRRNLDLY